MAIDENIDKNKHCTGNAWFQGHWKEEATWHIMPLPYSRKRSNDWLSASKVTFTRIWVKQHTEPLIKNWWYKNNKTTPKPLVYFVGQVPAVREILLSDIISQWLNPTESQYLSISKHTNNSSTILNSKDSAPPSHHFHGGFANVVLGVPCRSEGHDCSPYASSHVISYLFALTLTINISCENK